MSPRKIRLAGLAAATVLLSTAAAFALHTPLGRSLLGAESGCPFGGPAQAAQIDALRQTSLSPLRGSAPAPARPALGFQLDSAGRAQVEAWATARQLTCSVEASGTALRCERTAPGPIGDLSIRDLYARFDATGRLVAIDLMSEGMDAETAARRFESTRARLAGELGAPATSSGEATGAYLADKPFRRAAVQFRFADYAADLSATNLARGGVVVREQYRSIPPVASGG